MKKSNIESQERGNPLILISGDNASGTSTLLKYLEAAWQKLSPEVGAPSLEVVKAGGDLFRPLALYYQQYLENCQGDEQEAIKQFLEGVIRPALQDPVKFCQEDATFQEYLKQRASDEITRDFRRILEETAAVDEVDELVDRFPVAQAQKIETEEKGPRIFVFESFLAQLFFGEELGDELKPKLDGERQVARIHLQVSPEEAGWRALVRALNKGSQDSNDELRILREALPTEETRLALLRQETREKVLNELKNEKVADVYLALILAHNKFTSVNQQRREENIHSWERTYNFQWPEVLSLQGLHSIDTDELSPTEVFKQVLAILVEEIPQFGAVFLSIQSSLAAQET